MPSELIVHEKLVITYFANFASLTIFEKWTRFMYTLFAGSLATEITKLRLFLFFTEITIFLVLVLKLWCRRAHSKQLILWVEILNLITYFNFVFFILVGSWHNNKLMFENFGQNYIRIVITWILLVTSYALSQIQFLLFNFLQYLYSYWLREAFLLLFCYRRICSLWSYISTASDPLRIARILFHVF